ncbi:MAG: DNA internalization-related competence protein ComEC/Rec2 [Cyclonatronaceae bacterium]
MSAGTSIPFHTGAYPLLRVALVYAAGITAGGLLFAGSGPEQRAIGTTETSGTSGVSSTVVTSGKGDSCGTCGTLNGPAHASEIPDPVFIRGDDLFLSRAAETTFWWPEAWIWGMVSLGVLFCLTLPLLRPRFPALYPWQLYMVPAVYLLCITGFGTLQYLRHQLPDAPDEWLLRHFEPETLTFHAAARSDRTTRSGNRMLIVDVDSVQIEGLPTWKRRFRTEVLLRADRSPPGGLPSTGASLRFRGDLQLPPKPRNPNQFDYAAHLASRGIHTRIFATDIIGHIPNDRHSFWISRQIRMRSSISRLYSSGNAGLARAIILGDRSGLDPDLRTGFSRAGLAHLMAVSGMHVGFILLPVWIVLPWFRKTRALRLAGLALGGSILFFYAGVTGFSVSVSRASLMAFFLMLARLFHKPGTSMNILGAAAFLLLLHDPAILFDVGFQLSFLAVIIILTTLPGSRYLLPPQHRYRKTGALFQFIMVSVLVQGGLYPLLIHYFNEFSIAGPLSNTLAVPFVQFMFLWSFTCLGISIVHADAAALLNAPSDFILSTLASYVTWVGSHPVSWIEGTLPGNWLFGAWFFGTALFASLRIPALRYKMAAGLLACMVLLQSGQLIEKWMPPVLRVTFFDVGQGDAVLIETPGGHRFLYDTGAWSPGFDSATRTLVPEFRAMGIRKLDGVILSHPHADHIGGAASLLDHVMVDTIYQSPATYDSRLYHRYMSLATEKGIPVRLLESGHLIDTDPSMPMLVLAPSEEIPARDPNNMSVVLMVLYGDTRLLLMGDAEKETEALLVERFGPVLRADLLKVGHHASRTSSTGPFLEQVGTKKAVASLGMRNRYQHPHPEATYRLRAAGTTTRFTSLEGAIKYTSNGHVFRYVTW